MGSEGLASNAPQPITLGIPWILRTGVPWASNRIATIHRIKRAIGTSKSGYGTLAQILRTLAEGLREPVGIHSTICLSAAPRSGEWGDARGGTCHRGRREGDQGPCRRRCLPVAVRKECASLHEAARVVMALGSLRIDELPKPIGSH